MAGRIKLYIVFAIISLFLYSCRQPAVSPEKGLKKIGRLYSQIEKSYQSLIEKNPQKDEYKIGLAKFYYKYRDFAKAKKVLEGINSPQAKLLLAKSLYYLNEHTQALEIFDRLDTKDDEGLYLYGRICEEKNLFSSALKIYRRIKSPFYKQKAAVRIVGIKAGLKKEEIPSYLKRLIVSSPTADEYPNASAVILASRENVSVRQDNTMVMSVHNIVKILNDKGKKEWGEVLLEYDSTYERVELEYARTITPEGKMVYAGRENIRDVSKYLNFPLYSNVRVKIISMPEVSRNAVIEYKAKIYRSKLVNKKNFSFSYNIQEDFPILDAKFSISLPKQEKLHYKLINRKYLPAGITPKPLESIQGDKCMYVWHFENVSQFLPESEMVSSSYIRPAIIFSTFSSWQDIYQWWRKLYKDKIEPTPAIERETKRLVEGLNDRQEILRKVYDFCAKDIRYVAVEYGKGGYEPHSAEEVLTNRYGDCKDQAILLVSMLRYLGFDAFPVLVPTETAYNLREDFPALYFNHAIAAVETAGGKIIFMDPTASTTSFGYVPLGDQGRKVLVFKDKSPEILTIPFNTANKLDVSMDIRLNPGETAEITRTINSKGFYSAAQRYYLQFTPLHSLKEDFQKKMRDIASISEMKSFQIKNKDSLDKDPRITYSFKAYNLLSKVKNLRVMPVLTENFLGSSYISLDKRNYSVDLSGIYTLRISVDIHLPAVLRPEYLPDFMDIDSKWLGVKIGYKTEGNIISFLEVMRVRKKIVSPQEYPEFKKVLEKVLYNLKQQIILRRISE